MNDENRQELVTAPEFSLDEQQLQEQLYTNAGLEPVVEAGLKDYNERLQRESKLLNKVLGPRGSDIKGYGEAVARRVAFAVYSMLNRQYGGKVGDLRSHIMALQEERDREKAKYDELMGRVVGILGEEYKQLRVDSNTFMQKLNDTLGEDLAASKLDQKALAESLADIDGLRQKISDLEKEADELEKKRERQLEQASAEAREESNRLNDKIDKQAEKIENLEKENAGLSTELKELKAQYARLETAAKTVGESVKYEEIGKNLSDELYNFVLKDSKVPHMVLDGVGRFIDLKKYLKIAAQKGAREAANQAGASLEKSM